MDGPKPKRKIVGMKVIRKPGAVVQQGKPATADIGFEREKVKTTYTPTTIETGHKAYGKPGGGTNKEMRALIADAQSKRRDVTDYSSKGLHYKAGTTTVERTPEKFSTDIKVTPKIQKVAFDSKPVYEKPASSRMKPLKAAAVTLGGSTKGDHPATKGGIGHTKKVRITSVRKGRVPSGK
ncbi:MAG: hypothetical protein QM762_12655 [Chryseolinea sp.]